MDLDQTSRDGVDLITNAESNAQDLFTKLHSLMANSMNKEHVNNIKSNSEIAIVPPESPEKIGSTAASDTVMNFNELIRQDSVTTSTGAAHSNRTKRNCSPSKSLNQTAASSDRVDQHSCLQTASTSELSQHSSGLDFLLHACSALEPTAMTCENGLGKSQTRRRKRSEVLELTGADEEYCPEKQIPKGSRTSRNSTSRSFSSKSSQEVSVQKANKNQCLRWERGMVHGPCQNPDCEYPDESPQWRKGPPHAPILCNACGTRWLRNGTLKPLVPRRGIRYGKARSSKSQQRESLNAKESDKELKPSKQPRISSMNSALAAANEALASAVASLPEILRNSSDFSSSNAPTDPKTLQNQLKAMSEIAEAAHKAFAAAAEAAGHTQGNLAQVLQRSPFASKKCVVQSFNNGLSAENKPTFQEKTVKKGLIFNLEAVAGPAIVAQPFLPPPQPLKTLSPIQSLVIDRPISATP